MSMSQEEIEALMSGAGDIAPEETQEPQEEAPTEDLVEETPSPTQEEVAEVVPEDEPVIDTEEAQEESEVEEDDNLDNLDDILAGIDGIEDDIETPNEDTTSEEIDNKDESEVAGEKLEKMIDKNEYPLPAKDENKVVNQLNQVADDSEEKASQIFDVLSFILDENSEIQSYNKNMGIFIEEQIKLLDSLSIKFPNIAVFKENLENAKNLLESSKDLDDKVNGENNKIFEAMELMQYHDINRQKIERVMSVIKKLNYYLNGIFEDDSGKPDVQIAKHIPGDSSEIVDADDIESLIADFSEQ